MRTSLLLCLLVSVVLAPSARADDERFGAKNEVVPYGSVSFTYQNSTADGSSSTSTVTLSPAVLSFVAENLALGGQLTVQYQSQGGASATVAGVAPVIGYNAWLGERTSLFPQVTLVLGYESASFGGGGSGSISSFVLQPQIAIPVLWHPTSHFFLGLGPSASFSIYSNSSFSTSYVIGVTSVVGGYF